MEFQQQQQQEQQQQQRSYQQQQMKQKQQEQEPRDVQQRHQFWLQAEDLRMEGNDMFRGGRLEEALEKYSSALSILIKLANSEGSGNGNSSINGSVLEKTCVVLTNRAIVQFKLARFDKSIVDSCMALEMNESHIKARYWRANASLQLGHAVEAVHDLEVCAESGNKEALALLPEARRIAAGGLQEQEGASFVRQEETRGRARGSGYRGSSSSNSSVSRVTRSTSRSSRSGRSTSLSSGASSSGSSSEALSVMHEMGRASGQHDEYSGDDDDDDDDDDGDSGAFDSDDSYNAQEEEEEEEEEPWREGGKTQEEEEEEEGYLLGMDIDGHDISYTVCPAAGQPPEPCTGRAVRVAFTPLPTVTVTAAMDSLSLTRGGGGALPPPPPIAAPGGGSTATASGASVSPPLPRPDGQSSVRHPPALHPAVMMTRKLLASQMRQEEQHLVIQQQQQSGEVSPGEEVAGDSRRRGGSDASVGSVGSDVSRATDGNSSTSSWSSRSLVSGHESGSGALTSSEPDRGGLPPRQKQRMDVKRLIDQAEKKGKESGDLWYVLSFKWWQGWQLYVHYDEVDPLPAEEGPAEGQGRGVGGGGGGGSRRPSSRHRTRLPRGVAGRERGIPGPAAKTKTKTATRSTASGPAKGGGGASGRVRRLREEERMEHSVSTNDLTVNANVRDTEADGNVSRPSAIDNSALVQLPQDEEQQQQQQQQQRLAGSRSNRSVNQSVKQSSQQRLVLPGEGGRRLGLGLGDIGIHPVTGLCSLKSRLVQDYHYVLLPKDAFEALWEWYGGGPIIPRRVEQLYPPSGRDEGEEGGRGEEEEGILRVQLYPELVDLSPDTRGGGSINSNGSPSSSDQGAASLEASSSSSNSSSNRRSQDSQEAAESQLPQVPLPCGACGREGGSRCKGCYEAAYCSRTCQSAHWPYHKLLCHKKESRQSLPSSTSASHGGSGGGGLMRSWSPGLGGLGGGSGVGDTAVAKPRRGKTGLSNLGNTCFLNSTLQCLSHCYPITKHFLTDKFKEDLNEDNPFGTGGHLAQAYDKLLKKLWFGTDVCVAPARLKLAISRFAPQFSGFSQQDSQEVLGYLLDGLHEDLNRIKKKPYVEMPDGECGRPDAVVGAEAWEKMSLREQSVLVDHCYGQLKSSLTCPFPSCGKVSRKFDEFNLVTLELPTDFEDRVMFPTMVYRVPDIEEEEEEEKKEEGGEGHGRDKHAVKRAKKRPAWQTLVAVKVKCDATIADLKREMSKVVGVDRDCLLMTEVVQGNIRQVVKDAVPVCKVREDDNLVAYEVVPFVQSRYGHAALVHRRLVWDDDGDDAEEEEEEEEGEGGGGRRQRGTTPPQVDLLGLPLVVSFDWGWSCARLRRHVWAQVKAFVEVEGAENNLTEQQLAEEVGAILELSEVGQNGITYRRPSTATAAETEEAAAMGVKPTRLGRYLPSGDYGHASLRQVFRAPHSDSYTLHFLAVDWTGWLAQRVNADKFFAPPAHHLSIARLRDEGAAVLTLDQCFNKFSAPEKLDPENPWYCNRCKEHRQATKTLQFMRLPNLLILHLKRFALGSNRRGGQFRSKLDTPVDFPINGLDMSRFCHQEGEGLLAGDGQAPLYDLFAVSYHMGGMGFGHYTACVRDWDGGGLKDDWYLCDDDSCEKMDVKHVKDRAAYVLFYKRRQFR